MWGIAFTACIVLPHVFADCDNDIHVEGVSSSYGNQIVNGVYRKLYPKGCDSRDVFNHTDNDVYLYHIEDGLAGYWFFRDVYDCGNANVDDGFVRTKDAEFNPGLIRSGWEEKISNGNWQRDGDIDVDCYRLPTCRYRIMGAANESLNAYYDVYQSGNAECHFRDMYRHEKIEAYLYFIWSDTQREYFWVVGDKPCVDVVYYGAYLQNDDYSVSPAFIFGDWEERFADGSYAKNPSIDIDCFDGDPGLSPGLIAAIALSCAAFAGVVGGISWFLVAHR